MDIKSKNNVYIGMRYVPLFVGEWNIEKEYEPLSIVTYEGNSYTSRTFVPKGTEEGQDEDRYHTDIVGCANSTNVLTVLPLIQMLLAMKPKQEQTSILNAFNI